MARPVVVLLDPHHPYAGRLAAVCRDEWGLDTVCLWTSTSAWDRARSVHSFDRPSPVVAHYALPSGQPVQQVAGSLRRRHDVVAVLPHIELALLPAIELAQALGVPWADPEVVARFRDKHALKDFLRHVPAGPRMNATALVRTVGDVRAAQDTGAYSRFVLKPNDGTNNNRIGFFDESATDAQLASYLATTRDTLVIMGQYIDGDEYCVNGQVDAEGQVTILAVYRTHYAAANGRSNLAARFTLEPHGSQRFRACADYASHVMGVSGLSCSPFHMELKVDDEGPSMIEVGARLAGVGMGFDVAIAHAGSVDAFELAAAGYTGEATVRPQDPDWQAYDRRAMRTVCGVSSETVRVASVQGLAEIEAMPEFVRWVHVPEAGQRVDTTVDLRTSPWQVTIAGASEDQLDEAEERIRATIGWNGSASDRNPGARRVRTLAARVARRGALVPSVVRTRPRGLGGVGAPPEPAAPSRPRTKPAPTSVRLPDVGSESGPEMPPEQPATQGAAQ